MEIELVTEDESRERPAGRARDEPNQHPTLEPPKYVHNCVCSLAWSTGNI